MPENSPFKFLDAYGKADKDTFFGREEEIEQLFELVSQSRITLVYGQSGTGKTSLIRCGLANRFAESDWFDIYLRRNKDINVSLRQKLEEYSQPKKKEEGTLRERLRRRKKNKSEEEKSIVVTDAAGLEAVEPHPNELVRTLQGIYSVYLKPIYLIFDQFEELFILGQKEEQHQFIEDVAEVLNADLACHIILVMREEYLAQLYDFEKAVPYLFERRLRVEPMSQSSVSKVIRGSCERFQIQLPNRLETVPKIIQKVRVERDRTGRVQPVYLQIYLDKLYKNFQKENPGQPVVFSTELVDQTGEVEEVLAEFMEEQTEKIQNHLSEAFPDAYEDTVARILNAMATQEGTKQPVTLNQLKTLQVPEEQLHFCLEQLGGVRLVQQAEEDTYELSHDTLAHRIAGGRNRQELRELERMQSIRELFGRSGSETFQHILDLYRVYQPEQGKEAEVEVEKRTSWWSRLWSVLNPGSFFESKRGLLGKKELEFVGQHRSKLEESELFSAQEWSYVAESEQHRKRLDSLGRLAKWVVYTLTFLLFVSLAVIVGFYIKVSNQSETMVSGKAALDLVTLVSTTQEENPTQAYRKAFDLKKEIEGQDSVQEVKKTLDQIILDLERGFLERPFYLREISLPDSSRIREISTNEQGPFYLSQEFPDKSTLYRRNRNPVDSGSLFEIVGHIPHTVRDSIANMVVFQDNDQVWVTYNNPGERKFRIKKGRFQKGENLNDFKPDGDSLVFSSPVKFLLPVPEIGSVLVGSGGALYAVLNFKVDTLLDRPVEQLALLPEPSGRKIALVSSQKQWVYFYELNERLTLIDSLNLRNPVNCLAFSPDGKYLLAGNGKEGVIWNLDRRVPEQRLVGHKRNIKHATWTPDGFLFTADEGNKLKIWELHPREDDLLFRNHFPPEKTVFSPTADRLAFLNPTEDSLFQFRIGQDSEPLGSKAPVDNPLKALAYDTSNTLVVAVEGNLTVVLSQDGKKLGEEEYMSGPNDTIPKPPIPFTPRLNCLALNSRYVAIGGNSNKQVVVRVRGNNNLNYFALPHPRAPIHSVAFRPNALRQLVSTCADGNAYLWQLDTTDYNRTLSPVDTISAAGHKFREAVFSPDGAYLLLLSEQGQAFWSKQEDNTSLSGFGELHPIEGHPGGISCAAFSSGTSKTSLLTAGAGSGIVRIWKMEDGNLVEQPSIIRSPEKIIFTAFMEGDQKVLTIDTKGVARRWRVDASAVLKEKYGPPGSVKGTEKSK